MTQSYKALGATKFQHNAIVPFTKTKGPGSLLMGQTQTVRVGVTAYVNPGGSTPAMDSLKSEMVSIRADNAISLAMSGVAMALAVMQF